MKALRNTLLLLLSVIMMVACTPSEKPTGKSMNDAQRRNFERSDNRDVESRVDDLLSQMTIEEKIGQMTQLNNSTIVTESNWGAGTDLQITTKVDTAKLGKFLREYYVGSFLNGIAESPETWYQFYKDIQEYNMKVSRLKIPVIYGVDHVHGPNYLAGGTIFPQAINTAATYNNQVPADMAMVTATEISDIGHQWLFAPVLDIARTPLWGRYYETLGESPYVAKTMGSIYIRTVQGETPGSPYKIAATAKHFLGYSDPKYGWDRGATDISEQAMYEFHVPSFRAAVEAGVKSFMINSGELNGVPVHASPRILTGLLRDELKFKGVAVTDWEDIIRLYKNHKVAANEKEATYIAIMAGIDVAMTPYTPDFGDHIRALVKEGRIQEARIDLSVSRILRMKLEIGLFDNPLPRNDRFDRIGSPEHKAKALNAARESIVLMKNESILPLGKKVKNVLVAGPTINSKNALAGGWTLRWQTTDDSVFPADMLTVYTALQEQMTSSKVSLASDANELRSMASRSDVIVLGIGEQAYAEGYGSILDINLPSDQKDLVKSALATGKPVVLVLLGGRPRVITDEFSKSKAVLFAGLPGFEGAQAIAEIMTGKVNPSGKMSFNFPAAANRLVPHNHKSSEVLLAHEIPNPVALVPFGTGLSYTTYAYSDLMLSDSVVRKGGEITATIKVTNSGTIDGKEAVLWFLFDEVASISRPVRDLKYYEKDLIRAGEARTFSFTIRPEESLWFPNQMGEKVFEGGYFTLMVGDQKVRFKLATE